MTTDRRNMTSAEIQEEVYAKLADFSEANRSLAEQVHKIIMETNPSLHPRLWYGMPGYATSKDSAVLIFFREDEKYMTFGFTESINLETHNSLVPCAWFFTELDESAKKQIADIVLAATSK